MEWLPIAVVPVVLICAMLWLYRRISANAREIKARIAREHGADVRLISGCGMVDPPSRVPGVLALVGDRLIYESTTGLAGGKGEIPLAGAGIRWENPRASSHRMARKYRKARVLEVTPRSGGVKIFVLAEAAAGAWEQALPDRPQDGSTARGV